MNLTEEQNTAVLITGEKIVCIAGPGAGKTHTLVARIASDIRHGRAAPETSAVITFTAAAARELSRRLMADAVPLPAYIGTLHGWCLKFLNSARRQPLAVLDEGASEAMAKYVIERNHLKTTAAKIRKAISGIGLGIAEQHSHQLQMAVQIYRKMMNDEGAIDYDLILANALESLAATDPGVRNLYVDEFQDSSPIDLQIYERMRLNQLFVVGDPDQAIYGFRGGDITGLLSLVERASVVYLQDCFRCAGGICDLANNLIQRNMIRAPKKMRAVNPGQSTITCSNFATDFEERAALIQSIRGRLNEISPNDIAVLVRYNHERENIEEALKSAGIPIAGKRAPEPADWRYAVATLNMLANPGNFMAGVAWRCAKGESMNAAMEQCRALRMDGQPYGPNPEPVLDASIEAAGVSLESRLRIASLAASLGSKSALELSYAVREQQEQHSDGVTVSTYHRAKGLEWPEVYLPALEKNASPGQKAGIEKEEERRLVFVAVTRAERALRMSWARSRGNHYKRNQPEYTGGQSPFITEMGGPSK